jgi:hypothetical protein
MSMIRMLPSKRRNHIMLVNIDAEMSEILSSTLRIFRLD